MEGIWKQVAEHFGFLFPVAYAWGTYKFFDFLDQKISSEGRDLLASTMKLGKLGTQQIASALVEVFDLLYTRPLLHWRAFLRSMLFSVAVTGGWVVEQLATQQMTFWEIDFRTYVGFAGWISFWVNIGTDYISLFVIRRVLSESGAKPVRALFTGTVIGFAVVAIGSVVRSLWAALDVLGGFEAIWAYPYRELWEMFLGSFRPFAHFMVPALVVFIWLPLFALGITVIRLVNPFSWGVAKAQWFIKDGKEHPLEAVGWVAAITVFIVTAGWKTISIII